LVQNVRKSFGIYGGNSRKEDGKRRLMKEKNITQEHYQEKTKKLIIF
jgi:hypothetical protein